MNDTARLAVAAEEIMRTCGKTFLILILAAMFPFGGRAAASSAADIIRPGLAVNPAAGPGGGPRICVTRDGDLVVAVVSPGGNGHGGIRVFRLDSFDGTVLASISIGGDGWTIGGMAIDDRGRVVLAGSTAASRGADAASGSGSPAAGQVFVCRLDPGLERVERMATPLEGVAMALARGGDGSLYVGGVSSRPDVAGGENGFVIRLDRDSLDTTAALFIGGSGADRVTALAVNSRGEVVAAGNTVSADDFPLTERAWQPQINVDREAGFVALLDSGLDRILAATAINASRAERVGAVSIGRDDSVVVAGTTASRDFPSTRGDVHHGGDDAFVVELSRDLSTLRGARVFGGSGMDSGRSLASVAGTFIVLAVESDSPVVEGIKTPLKNSGGRDIDLFFLGPSLKLLRPARAATGAPDRSPALALGEGNRVLMAGVSGEGNRAELYISGQDLY